MEIQHNNNEKNGSFKGFSNGYKVGEMTYTWAGTNKFIIDHTEVSTDFNGQGVGKKMVLVAVDYARKNNLKILPLCPFAKSVFSRESSLNDVLFY
ncbi:MAG: N-acetyltransferase [Flavobacteriaceae bacterium]|nr:N-acetyltransferase [Flavobacteriaceae bacterium]